MSRWTILAILFIARVAMAFQFQTLGSSGPLLIRDLGLSYADIGSLIGLYLLPGIIIAFPGGVLGQRFGRNVALAGLALMAVGGIVTAMGEGLAGLAAGRLISGIGAVLLNVLLAKMVADWFTDRALPTAMAILVTSWPLGIGAGLAAGYPVAAQLGWPFLMWVGTAFSLISLALILAFYRDPPSHQPGPAAVQSALSRRELGMAVIAGGIWAFYNAGFIILISFAPDFFAARGYSISQGSSIVSLLGWFLVPMIVVGGYLATRFRQHDLVMAGGFIGATLAAATLPVTAFPVALFIGVAIAAGLPAGPIMTLPVEAARPQSRAAAMGVYFSCYYLGMALLPAFAGWVRDRAATPSAPVLVAAGSMVVALLLLGLFRACNRR